MVLADFDQACETLWGALYRIASLSYLGSVGDDRARHLAEQVLRAILLGRRTETPANGRPASSQVLSPLWFAGSIGRTRTGVRRRSSSWGLPIDRDDVEEALETTFELDGEVTGAGSGTGRCPLGLEIAESRTRPRPWSVSGRCCPN